MIIERFDYPLPGELIAQYPVERGSERLLVLDRGSGRTTHASFGDLASYLRPGDLLVLNDTRVIRARLLGNKASGGRVELLLVRELSPGTWTCLLKASKSPSAGAVLQFPEGLRATVEGRRDDLFEVRFSSPDLVTKIGRVPLPPYIDRDPEAADESCYQTVYARHEGSVAAPTAGLHFTDRFLASLAPQGIGTAFITLHVGPGTFQPVRTRNVEDHRMHEEEFIVSPDASEAIEKAREEGRRVIAVGTTTTRVLEHLMAEYGEIRAGRGSSSIFIYEGFTFRCVDALLTNFHLPCSTLLMLVAAFGGYDHIMRAYREAVDERYRFFSYGDAMLIV
ncbi:MAG TPA: tRNA preQ1(34) S-adenosylmethionine ribosyltransferase-isomerase QueA [Deltaproteobacteria bacterium]|nr:tRNA preQ1(34) S-adenosylmethionine ribosyltransferase-isomerase QueA [Deltaproteobacteria bacterium]HOI08649.1 tRNA preQ1(34) S-adenosylmethionine ribosyltransferase-isomerase QueA [Deltaproteobacteria bacterium]